jgi:hypothetical protein
MRTLILLTLVATLTGCQHAQKCTQTCRSTPAQPACKTRDSGSCCEQTTNRPRCDLTNACRSVQSSCQKVCQTPANLGCKRLGLGWHEFRVPVPKLKTQQTVCASNRQCTTGRTCDSKTCCTQPPAGCCNEFPVRANDPTPFLTLPPEQPAASTQPQASQWGTMPNQSTSGTWNSATQSTNALEQRTIALETQVHEIHSMLQQRQATHLPNTEYQVPGVPMQRQDVIMLPAPPAWRTMDGVPPIPNSPIEQTGATGWNSGTYRTAGNPQMWAHSPQNIQRSMLR